MILVKLMLEQLTKEKQDLSWVGVESISIEAGEPLQLFQCARAVKSALRIAFAQLE